MAVTGGGRRGGRGRVGRRRYRRLHLNLVIENRVAANDPLCGPLPSPFTPPPLATPLPVICGDT